MLDSTEQVAAPRSTEDHTCSFGLLQQFGSWVALRAIEGSRYIVIAASDNSKFVIGHTPEDLFSLHCFSDLLPGRNRDQFRTRLTGWQQTNLKFSISNISEIFYTSISSADTSGPGFWCTLSPGRGFADIWICEFEPHLQGPEIQVGLRTPSRLLKYKSTPKEWVESTTRKSRPLSTSRGVQECLSTITTASLTRTFNEIQSQIVSATSIEILFDRVVGIVSELTKFDRTLVYRVDEGQCGVVVAECLNPVASEDLFIGLRFQEPYDTSQTAAVFKEERVQLLRNRLQQPAAIVCRNTEYIEKLDLTGSYLRQMSADQMDTFSDMDISSSMAVALVVRNELWGSIICHSYGSQITPIPPPIRKICRDIGNCVSSQVERLLNKKALDAQAILVTGFLNLSPRGFITESPGHLLQVFAADFGVLVLNDEIRDIGEIRPRYEALALVQYFQTHRAISILASQNIKKDFHNLDCQLELSTIAGILVIPLHGNRTDYLMLFRKEQLIETREEGYSRERFQRLDEQCIEPSAGFGRWEKYAANRSREWTECQCKFSNHRENYP
jgi:light-regulated signal transduction histidine kinase (bacteriophytochrome)